MLVCDLVLEVRASRSLSADQVARLEREIFGQGNPSNDILAALPHIDMHACRADPTWAALLARVASAGLSLTSEAALPSPMMAARAA